MVWRGVTARCRTAILEELVTSMMMAGNEDVCACVLTRHDRIGNGSWHWLDVGSSRLGILLRGVSIIVFTGAIFLSKCNHHRIKMKHIIITIEAYPRDYPPYQHSGSNQTFDISLIVNVQASSWKPSDYFFGSYQFSGGSSLRVSRSL